MYDYMSTKSTFEIMNLWGFVSELFVDKLLNNDDEKQSKNYTLN